MSFFLLVNVPADFERVEWVGCGALGREREGSSASLDMEEFRLSLRTTQDNHLIRENNQRVSTGVAPKTKSITGAKSISDTCKVVVEVG